MCGIELGAQSSKADWWEDATQQIAGGRGKVNMTVNTDPANGRILNHSEVNVSWRYSWLPVFLVRVRPKDVGASQRMPPEHQLSPFNR
jgi:hypothetical protein